MLTVLEWFPNLHWLVTEQRQVLWIYAAMWLGFSVRIHLTLRLMLAVRPERPRLLAEGAQLAEMVGQASLLLGVMGTLVGVSMSAATNGVAGALANFSQAFGIAVITTLVGGSLHLLCWLLSVLEEHLARAKQP